MLQAAYATLCHQLDHRYALTGKEVTSILMQRLIKVDGKVSTAAALAVGGC